MNPLNLSMRLKIRQIMEFGSCVYRKTVHETVSNARIACDP